MMVIVDYGMGNIGSIGNALERMGVPFLFSADPAAIEAADHLILAGVGAFDHGMAQLRERGLIPLLEEKVLEKKTPILGLCLGLQLFTRGSEEGTASGLGWIPADTVRFQADESAKGHMFKIPHMGWNTVFPQYRHPLLDGIPSDDSFYFMHSYHLTAVPEEMVLATTEYGASFPSIVVSGNIAGVQFHPEKSRNAGLCLLANFTRWSSC